MSINQENADWYKNFSEIDYFLSSNLRESKWGIDRLLQRIILFDKSKQHIPYLLLIQLIHYNNKYDQLIKKEIVSKLVSELYRNVIQKATRNQLFDFMPPYYVISLLLDLHIAGYKIDTLLRKFKPNPGENPVVTLQLFGNYNVEGFPEALLFLYSKMVFSGRLGDGILSKLSIMALYYKNFHGFHYIFSQIRKEDFKVRPLIYLAVEYIEENMIDEALKIEKKLKEFKDKCDFYLSISLSMAKHGKIDVLKELKRSINEPSLNICILRGLVQYYLNIGNKEIALKLFSEAILNLDHIKDKLIRSMQTIVIINMALKLDKPELYAKHMDDLLFSMKHAHKEIEEHRILKMNLLQVLLNNNQKEKTKELNDFWSKDFYDKWVDIHIIILDLLNHIDHELKSGNHQVEMNKDRDFSVTYKAVFNALDLMDEDESKDESRYYVTLNMAKNGFYKESLNMRNSMKEDSGTLRIDASLPFYALNNKHFKQALDFANSISDEKTRLDIFLCISLYLEKESKTEESFKMIRNWAIYNFDMV
jgi:hypothetical protein